MLHPSYDDLQEVVSESTEKINGRYGLVMAVAKRARQIMDTKYPEGVENPNKDINAVTVSVDEIYNKKVRVK